MAVKYCTKFMGHISSFSRLLQDKLDIWEQSVEAELQI